MLSNEENTPGSNRNTSGRSSSAGQDLPDSDHDLERMQPEEVTLDLPDVADIPGQEHIHVAPLGEFADTTISSDDEEGEGLFDDDDEDETGIMTGSDADVTTADKKALEQADEDMPGGDDEGLREAGLDEEDAAGEPLNEGSLTTDVSGSDLDVPGADADDADEAVGEEDEENNDYSLGGDSNNNLTEDTQ